MSYLLDTCALIWLGMGGGDLSEDARKRISVASALHYSSISAWEIARLQGEGKIVIPNTPDGFLSDLVDLYGLSAIPPTDDIMIRAAQLPLPRFHQHTLQLFPLRVSCPVHHAGTLAKTRTGVNPYLQFPHGWPLAIS